MGAARRSASTAPQTATRPLSWHPALVPRGSWGVPASERALVNLRSEAKIVSALTAGLAALSAMESLGVSPQGRWVLAGDDLPSLAPERGTVGTAADTPGEWVRQFLSLLGSRPGKGSLRPVLPRRHPHGAAISAWAARWLEAASGAREALVDLLEVLAAEGVEPGLPAAWGVAAPWTPSDDLVSPGLHRVRLAGPAAQSALAAWCEREGVTRVALGGAAPYPFASLEPLVRAALGSEPREAQEWISGRMRDPARLAGDLASALDAARSGLCLWPAESLDMNAAEILDRCADGLSRPLLLAGDRGSPAGAFGELATVALPKAGEAWFRLHLRAAGGDGGDALESAVSRPEGLLRPGASLLSLPLRSPTGGDESVSAPDPSESGPGIAVATLLAADAARLAGRSEEAALLCARAHVLSGQTELALACLGNAAGAEPDWIRAKAWERRQDFAETATAAGRALGASLPEGLRGEARTVEGQSRWLSGERERGLRLLKAARGEAREPDSEALAILALATCSLLGGDASGAEGLLAEAGALLPHCRRPITAIVWHQRRALLLRKRGLYGGAAESFACAASLAAGAWDHWMESVSLLETGNALRLQYRFEKARGLLMRAEEGFCTLGLERVREAARFDRMLCDAESGRLLDAQKALEAGLTRPTPGADRSVDRYWLARVLQLRGEPAPALDQIALALEEVRRRPDPEVEAPLRILRARLLLDAHQTGRLRAALEEVRGLSDSAPDPDDRLDAASVLLEAAARGHGRPGDAPGAAAEKAAREASPSARARWALARARAQCGEPGALFAEALGLARQISDPALEAEALWGCAARGDLPALAPDEAERLSGFLSRNRLRGETRRLLPLLSRWVQPPPAAPPTEPTSPVLLLEEARQGRADLAGCMAAVGARGAVLRAPGAPPRWEGAPAAAQREAMAGMAGIEGLVPAAGGWILGAAGRGGTWAGFAWAGSEPPGGEEAALARLWTTVLPPPDFASPTPPASERSDPILDRLLLGKAPALLDLRRRLAEAAPFSFPVLLTGEPGVGKEACARALHLLSPRTAKPWVPANCANLSPTLAASLLFGHRRGAFTGADREGTGLVEAARGGTLFLDEVGELPVETQAQLLRFLQDGSYSPLGEPRSRTSDARVVAATNLDLERAVAEGRFRADLFHRLNVIRVQVPPLRDRAGDVPLLFEHFLGEAARAEGRPVPIVDGEVWGHLTGGRWPGNVRELQNLARSLLVTGSSSGRITVGDLPEAARLSTTRPALPGGLRGRLLTAERAAVAEALGHSGGNISAAARELGITRQALARKMARRIPTRVGDSPPFLPSDGAPSPARGSERGRA